MAKAKPSVVPPVEASPQGEQVVSVMKFKTTLCKKWSYTKSESLWEMGDLAVFLWALERPNEALAIARVVAIEVPSPPELKGGRFNFNLWCPATRLHALIVHLGTDRLKADIEQSRRAILNEPGFARDNPDYLLEQVDDAKSVLVAATGIESQKWECQNISRSVACMTLFAELAKGGDPLFAPYAHDAQHLIPQLLTKLGTRLVEKK